MIVCIHTDPEIWVSLGTIILSVSSQRCPKGWQAGPVGSLQFAERLPPARGLWIDSLKHSMPRLREIKYFSAFVNRFFFFQPPRDACNTTFYFSGRPRGTEVASELASKLFALLSGEVWVACVCGWQSTCSWTWAKVHPTLQQTAATPVKVPVRSIWPNLWFLHSLN